MYYNLPAVRVFMVHFFSAVGKVATATKTVSVFVIIRQDRVIFDKCPIQLLFIMIVDVGAILFQLKSTVISPIGYIY